MYLDSLSPSDKARYMRKLEAVRSPGRCPYALPALTWVNDPTQWPDLQYPEVYDYLINTPGVFTREAMKNRRSLEAYNQFQSGWVQTVLHFCPDNSVVIMKADVRPSQRMNDEPHHPWVGIERKDCNITAAHCTCLAGLGESCSHVAALLFKVEAAVRMGYTTEACTDLPCKWNADFVKKVEAQTVSHISFYTKKAIDKAKCRQRTRFVPDPATPSEQKTLLDRLANLESPPVALSLYDEYSSPFHHKNPVPPCLQLPARLRDLFSEELKTLSEDDLGRKAEEVYVSLMEMEEAQIAYLENATTGQASSVLWRDYRVGRITASVVHQVMHTSMANPARSLVQKICQEPGERSQPGLDSARGWGCQHESDALLAYQIAMETSHTDVTVTRPGLKLSVQYPFLGATADGIMTCTCHAAPRVVEVKCPFTKKDVTSEAELLDDPSFYVDRAGLKKTHPYHSQVQMQMFCYNMATCDFVVWTPSLTVVVQVEYDQTFPTTILHLVAFFRAIILPELLTRRMENSVAEHVQPTEEVETLYCFCQKPSAGSMIGCDNPCCEYKWFHFHCVGIKRIPRGVWLCKECKKKKV